MKVRYLRKGLASSIGLVFLASFSSGHAAERVAAKTMRPTEKAAAARVDATLLHAFDSLPQVPALTDDEAFLRRIHNKIFVDAVDWS